MPAGSCGEKTVSIATLGSVWYRAIPEEIAVDAANSPHLANLGSQTNNLDPYMCAMLDDDVGVVGELRRSRAGIVLDLVGHQLRRPLATRRPPTIALETAYVGGDKEAQWAGLRKEAMGIHRLGDGIDLAVSAKAEPRVSTSPYPTTSPLNGRQTTAR
jgi:hypothetical protein